MTEVAATEFARHFGRYREVAQRQAVAVTSHDRITGYFISAHEYEAYLHLKSIMPVAVAVEDLDSRTLKALESSRMDARHDTLNALMD